MARNIQHYPRARVPASKRIAYLRGKLLEKRRRLLENLVSGLTAPVETSGQTPADTVDLASATTAQETSYEIGSVETAAVAQIDEALQRLENGTYGICEDCGRRIPEARLRVLPFAARCIECKEREEQENRMHEELPMSWEDLEALGGEEAGAAEAAVETVRGRRPA